MLQFSARHADGLASFHGKSMNDRDTQLVQALSTLRDRCARKTIVCTIGIAVVFIAFFAVGLCGPSDPVSTWSQPAQICAGIACLAVALLHMYCCANAFVGVHQLEWYERRIANVRKSYEDTAVVDNLIHSKQHFAILLRGFDHESQFAVIALPGTEYAAPVEHTYHTELYEALLQPVKNYMPVFELLNDRDFTKTFVVGRINCEGDWKSTFQFYASKASLLILLAESLTSGIKHEIRWIKETRRESVAVLLATSSVRRRLREQALELENTWTVSEMGIAGLQFVNVPEGLISELDERACKAIQSTE